MHGIRAIAVALSVVILASCVIPVTEANAPTTAPAGAPGGAPTSSLVDPRARPAVCRAISWVHSKQLGDGGFGVSRNGGSVATATADVVYTLALLGENPDSGRWTSPGGKSALDALAALAPDYVGTDAGQAGKVARAVAMAGGDPRNFAGMDLLKIIVDAYNPVTGRYHPSFAYRHTLAIEGLLQAGETVPPAAVAALRSAQLADGGWFWDFSATTADVDTTGRVLQLLAGPLGIVDGPAYQKAAEYLRNQQLAAGGWNVGNLTSPANANSTGLAVGALLAAAVDPQSTAFRKNGAGALDTLLSFQEPSGAFVYIQQPGKEEVRLMATLDALAALAQLSAQPVCEVVRMPLLLRR